MPKGDNNKKYKPEYVDSLPMMFANGESVAEVCVELNISRQAFYDWSDKYPDFKEAYNEGKMRSEAWWSKLGRAGAAGKVDINPTTWIFNMKNRFSWKDKVETQITGADGGAIQTESNVTWTIKPVKSIDES